MMQSHLRPTGLVAVVTTAASCTLIAMAFGLSFATAEENRAGLSWLTSDAIRGTFSGKGLGGQYPNGNPWSESIFQNGTTDYREGQKRWFGQWWVKDREFCFSYPPPGLGGCFRVVRISTNCFELYEFSSVTAKADEPPDIADLWNGRMWLASQPTTCEERPSS